MFNGARNCDPSDAKIRFHLDCRGRPDVVSWIKPGEHFKVDELSQWCVTLLESPDAVKYGWVVAYVMGTPSIMIT